MKARIDLVRRLISIDLGPGERMDFPPELAKVEGLGKMVGDHA